MAIPFRAAHWMALRRDDSEAAAYAGLLRERAGIAYSAIDGNLILASAGILTEGTIGAVWALISDEIKRDHPIWFLRTARRLLMPVVQTLGLSRVEALVDPTIDVNCQWIKWMGFEFELRKKRAKANGDPLDSYVLFP